MSRASLGDRCNTPALRDPLVERGLLAHGPLSDGSLTDRDRDRLKLVKHIASKPEGIVVSRLVHWVLKGVNPNDWHGMPDLSGDEWERHDQKLDSIHRGGDRIALDGSDPDYQFTRRFLDDLETADLVRLEDSPAGRVAHPTLSLLDLISQGITETAHAGAPPVFDRDFAHTILSSTNSLSDAQKGFLDRSLRRYIHRIEDYRLCFDVDFYDHRSRGGSRRMTKDYKTRFNDEGRINKGFARYNQALRHAYEHAENAVLVTLTSDPGDAVDDDRPDPRSLLELTESINPNFHRLTQYMASDPSTKGDTRKPGVPAYRTDRADAVTSRPRERLDYLKVLEFTERGLPHLHVLFFDCPTDENGMPYLMHKQELSDKWSDYGQGMIVDTYPLVFRDDLDDVGNFGTEVVYDENGDVVRDENGAAETRPVSKGFVCWYRYGENEYSEPEVKELSRSHRVDMFGTEDNPQQKTAGAYLGEYLSVTYAALADAAESVEFETSGDQIDTWKLALYWATEKRFWSISRELELAIERDDRLDDDVQRGVQWAEREDVKLALEAIGEAHHVPDGLTSEQAARSAETAIERVVTSPYVRIDYLGTYRYDDLPTRNLNTISLEAVEQADTDPDANLSIARGDRPPPVAQVWS